MQVFTCNTADSRVFEEGSRRRQVDEWGSWKTRRQKREKTNSKKTARGQKCYPKQEVEPQIQRWTHLNNKNGFFFVLCHQQQLSAFLEGVISHYSRSRCWLLYIWTNEDHLRGSIAPDNRKIDSPFRWFQKSYTGYCIWKCYRNLKKRNETQEHGDVRFNFSNVMIGDFLFVFACFQFSILVFFTLWIKLAFTSNAVPEHLMAWIYMTSESAPEGSRRWNRS